MRVRLVAIVLVLVLACLGRARADSANQDPLGGAFIPPDVVMAHQQELNISDQQRSALVADMEQAQQRFTQLQWQLSAAMEKLASIVKQPHVDESKALAQLDAEQQIEREIKRTQLRLMIQVKNQLTPEQQAKALEFAHARAH